MAGRQTQSVKSAEDNKLLLYRIDQVEKKIDGVSNKLDAREDIKKADITELRDAILARLMEIKKDLEDEIEKKADKSTVDDLKTRLNAYSAAITSVIVGLALYFLTQLGKQ